jgi:CSLREA domain-containing protein
VVNSSADVAADEGVCTLREAITAANTDTASGLSSGECAAGSGVDTISFAITGSPSFTNNGKPGFSIKPTLGLPAITQQVVIDGYTQPNSLANTAQAPLPLNGMLLIEVDGSLLAAETNGIKLEGSSANSQIRGLVINNFSRANALDIAVDGVVVQGNYLGVNPHGTAAKPNQVAVNGTATSTKGKNALVGGLSPEHRNLVSGNTDGPTATGMYPASGWLIQGNYIGIAADGLTPITNSTVGGSGSLSVDHSDDVVIGGSDPAAINVIGASFGHGIAPLDVSDITIEGNYIGLGYDGSTVLGSVGGGNGSGITLSQSAGEGRIVNNKIAGWAKGGIAVNAASDDVLIEGNTVLGNRVDGIYANAGSSNIRIRNNTVHDNDRHGVNILGSLDATVEHNVIYGNKLGGVGVVGVSAMGYSADTILIRSNIIGANASGTIAASNGAGVIISGDPTNVIVGGVNQADSNTIVGSKGAGVAIGSSTVQIASLTLVPHKVTVLGNKIYNTTSTSTFNSGLGIDLLEFTDTSVPPDAIYDTMVNEGVNSNDALDSDTGPNGYINFPVVHSVKQSGSSAAIDFDLDAIDSPVDQYRVEFFANDAPHPTGHGEGQLFLGAITVSSGNGQQATINLPQAISLAGKSVSATTTAIDSSTHSGFGATSEFGPLVMATVTATNESSQVSSSGGSLGRLANSGSNLAAFLMAAGVVVVIAGFVFISRLKVRV